MKSTSVKHLTLTALMASLALILSFIESSFIVIQALPGVKVGLANVIVMFALFYIGKDTALSIVIIKAVFSFFTRGLLAGGLSLAGGLFSLAIIILASRRKNTSISIISVFGALSHNLAQFFVITAVYYPLSMLHYLPFLIISGCVFGVVSAIFLKSIQKPLSKLWRK